MYRDHNQRQFARQLRSNLTEAEQKLWQAIRNRQLRGRKFRRQAAIGDYIVDFVCFDESLIVELDGGQHNESSARNYDARRTLWLEAQGFRVLRYWNHDVLGDVDSVVEAIWLAIESNSAGRHPSPSPSPSRGGD